MKGNHITIVHVGLWIRLVLLKACWYQKGAFWDEIHFRKPDRMLGSISRAAECISKPRHLFWIPVHEQYHLAVRCRGLWLLFMTLATSFAVDPSQIKGHILFCSAFEEDVDIFLETHFSWSIHSPLYHLPQVMQWMWTASQERSFK